MIDKKDLLRYTISCVKRRTCDSGVVGNARPCQGRDRGFEPRLSLAGHPKGCPFLLSGIVRKEKVYYNFFPKTGANALT